jgi:addiction module RelE/StbE family toxin
MQVRWTTAAARDLENIADYLFEKTPENAARLIREICDAVFALRIYPNRGRPGKKSGTRELVLPALPYIVVYKVAGDVLHIARILHGAQQWPR